jgi:hypothetical protein|tara:strand:- start:110 stop:280 length:171 start_codon:yes stop_codon:yes gene_type:complete
MKVDDRGWIEWEKSDFKKHGMIATYLLGECRCKKCKARILQGDLEPKRFPARYNSE